MSSALRPPSELPVSTGGAGVVADGALLAGPTAFAAHQVCFESAGALQRLLTAAFKRKLQGGFEPYERLWRFLTKEDTAGGKPSAAVARAQERRGYIIVPGN